MDVNDAYANAYAEVWEILHHLPEEEYKKIPKSKLEFFDTHRNRAHIFKLDPKKTTE